MFRVTANEDTPGYKGCRPDVSETHSTSAQTARAEAGDARRKGSTETAHFPHIVVAVPVATPLGLSSIRMEAGEVVCVAEPEVFKAVSGY